MEKGLELFGQDKMVASYEKKISEVETLLGKKEVEIALFQNFLEKSCPQKRR